MNDIIEPDKELNVGFIGWEGLLSIKKSRSKDGKEKKIILNITHRHIIISQFFQNTYR